MPAFAGFSTTAPFSKGRLKWMKPWAYLKKLKGDSSSPTLLTITAAPFWKIPSHSSRLFKSTLGCNFLKLFLKLSPSLLNLVLFTCSQSTEGKINSSTNKAEVLETFSRAISNSFNMDGVSWNMKKNNYIFICRNRLKARFHILLTKGNNLEPHFIHCGVLIDSSDCKRTTSAFIVSTYISQRIQVKTSL